MTPQKRLGNFFQNLKRTIETPFFSSWPPWCGSQATMAFIPESHTPFPWYTSPQTSGFHSFVLHTCPFLVGNFSEENHGNNSHMVAITGGRHLSFYRSCNMFHLWLCQLPLTYRTAKIPYSSLPGVISPFWHAIPIGSWFLNCSPKSSASEEPLIGLEQNIMLTTWWFLPLI